MTDSPSRLSGLAADLYQLTMALAHFREGRTRERATFELFVRRLPHHRGYLVVCGLETCLNFLQRVRFDAEAVAYLRSLPVFATAPDDFWRYLADFRFTADVWAVPEGTIAFAGEPLLRVAGPLIEAQLVETFLLTAVNHQTAIATKAARIVGAAAARPVFEFGARRAHGFEGSVESARAAYIGGCFATSNLEAGRRFGIPVVGTSAHSFVLSHSTESEAFESFSRCYPHGCTLLVDTYDLADGIRNAARIEPPIAAVRIDSGDLAVESFRARRLLDELGRADTRIILSGDLNEWAIEELVRQAAPVDAFGVGTDLITSRDAPALGGVYKLTELESNGVKRFVFKRSEGKGTFPAAKQVYRFAGGDGCWSHDLVTTADEPVLGGEALLKRVMRGGIPLAPPEALEALRARAAAGLARLPVDVRAIEPRADYPVRVSEALTRLLD